LAIAWVGGTYNASIKDSENRIRYVELAIEQLRSPPTPETTALREWAVELLDSQSPVKLSPAAKAQLKSNSLLSATAAGAAIASGTAKLSVGKATGE
jgi:predicted aconitase